MNKAWAILLALVAGLATGAAIGDRAPVAVLIAETAGGLWLDALRMTIVPLVVALLVTGVASASGADGVTARALRLFVALLLVSAVLGAAISAAWVTAWPPAAGLAESLRATIPEGAMPPMPPIGDWLRSFVPANVVKAAADGAIVPLVLFALLFGFAITKIEADARARLTGFFEGVAAAMIVVVRWVLTIAPLGVFALALVVASRTGLGVAGALVSYVLLIVAVALVLTVLGFALARAAGGVGVGAFARAVAPAQAVALSTQSSLASLPVMLAGAERLALPQRIAAVVLPLAVAVFRVSGPAGMTATTFVLAALYGVPMTIERVAIVCAVATVCSLIVVGLPGQVSFFAAFAPPAMAIGVPIEMLPLLLAIDVIPDMFRTTANVTMDLAVTTVAARAQPRTNVQTP